MPPAFPTLDDLSKCLIPTVAAYNRTSPAPATCIHVHPSYRFPAGALIDGYVCGLQVVNDSRVHPDQLIIASSRIGPNEPMPTAPPPKTLTEKESRTFLERLNGNRPPRRRPAGYPEGPPLAPGESRLGWNATTGTVCLDHGEDGLVEMTAQQAVAMAEGLIAAARKATREPLTVNIGGKPPC